MPTVPIHRALISPDHRERVELFGSRDRLYGFRISRRESETWQPVAESGGYPSYARAVVEAAKEVGWLGRALAPEADWRMTYHLELLRGLTFHFATFTKERFGDHDHCSACRAKFMERDLPDVQHQGYVTRYDIPNASGDRQWNWMCEQCFSDLRTEMQWQLEDEPRP